MATQPSAALAQDSEAARSPLLARRRMVGFGFKKKDTTPRPGAAPEDAAAKIQASLRGKQVRAEEAKKGEAAAKIQAIKRGKSGREDALLLGEIAAGKKEAAARAQAVQFQTADAPAGGGASGGLEWLQRALKECAGENGWNTLVGLPSKIPCWPAAGAAAAGAAEPGLSGHDKKELSVALMQKVSELFKLMDENGDGMITVAEATVFWKKNWAKVNAKAMFNEVDDDNNGSVTYEEWLDFWRNVNAQPDYDEETVLEELENIKEGGSWVDWNDGRTT